MLYDVFMIVMLPVLWFALNLFSIAVIFLYQFGHAIPTLLFTQKPVAIYVGTYGDNIGKKLTIGWLSIYIKPKFAFLKQNGLCVYDTQMPFNCQVATVLGGPVVAILLIYILTICTVFSDYNTYVRIATGFALLVAVLNLIINLFPRKLLVKSSERLYYSDGYQLILMLENKPNYINIMNAYRLYDEGKYDPALKHLLTTNSKYMEDSVYGLTIACYVHLQRYDEALKLQSKYHDAKWQESVTANDHYLLGYAAMQLKQYHLALAEFYITIGQSPNHFKSRKDRAFTYNALQEYSTAKEEATKAIFIQENSSEGFSYRAYANFMLGKTGEAVTDAEKALSLDETNAYAHLVMGMYQLDRGKTEQALKSLEHAKRLDPEMLYVDEQLARVKQTV